MDNTQELNEKIEKLSNEEREDVLKYINNKFTETRLDTLPIGQITGDFNIPTYQRGYRWTQLEVERLINDIWENRNKNYCLQPVVVIKNGLNFDIIDGQQRLTTLYIIYKYIGTITGNNENKYSLEYSSRPNSKEFLTNIDKKNDKDAMKYIDFYFMKKAFETVKSKFRELKIDDSTKVDEFLTLLRDKVFVIWYQVGTDEDPHKLFQRLNMWKIPLTNSELIKALFLNDSALNNNIRLKEKIAFEWDNIERTLNNPSIWYFVTKEKMDSYQTKIDLILDLIANKDKKDERNGIKDPYDTFFYFQNKLKYESNLDEVLENEWQNIYDIFNVILSWYNDNEVYHKIGFLISDKSNKSVDLLDLYKTWEDTTDKNTFKQDLDNKIQNSIKECFNNGDNCNWLVTEFNKDVKTEDEKKLALRKCLSKLDYNNTYEQIKTILLYMNVISIKGRDKSSYKFPFELYNNTKWSLEHIFAQNSADLIDIESQKCWVKEYKNYINYQVDDSTKDKDIRDQEIQAIQQDINKFLQIESTEGNGETNELFRKIETEIKDINNNVLHSISNMALLSCVHNSSLGNNTFMEKRKIIQQKEKAGEFIPIWTKKVFNKSFLELTAEDSKVNYQYWTLKDRECYENKIIEQLLPIVKNIVENLEER